MADTQSTGGLRVSMERPSEQVALVEARSPEHREFFSVMVGHTTLAITVLDVGDAPHREPRVYAVEKPATWSMDGTAEDLLVAIWALLLPS